MVLREWWSSVAYHAPPHEKRLCAKLFWAIWKSAACAFGWPMKTPEWQETRPVKATEQLPLAYPGHDPG